MRPEGGSNATIRTPKSLKEEAESDVSRKKEESASK